MRFSEVILTSIFIIGIIYTAVPFAISVYAFVILPHMHNEDVCVVENEIIVESPKVYNYQPIPEYATTSHRSKSITQLQNALQVCNPPQPYSESFDCSNLAAYSEHYLENNGFNTTISASVSQGHAWCTVHNIINYTEVQVECISPAYIRPSLGPVELTYNNITEAIAGEYPYEWDWWTV